MPTPIHSPGGPLERVASRHLETREKAVELFARRGFAQVGLRELATHLGIKAGSIYNHIESKEALLFELMETFYGDLLEIVAKRSTAGAQKRLNELIDAHLDLHARKSDFFVVAQQQLHCLEPQHQASILALRRRYEEHLIQLLKPFGISSSPSVATATVRTFSGLLSHLPVWSASAALDSAAHRRFLRNIALSVIRGALEKPAPVLALLPSRAKAAS